MIENVGLFIGGALWGFALAFQVFFKRWLAQRDTIGEGVREQTRKVAFLSRMAGGDCEVRSEAKVTTIDGEFQVQVIRRGE